jgi:hypothetical protein
MPAVLLLPLLLLDQPVQQAQQDQARQLPLLTLTLSLLLLLLPAAATLLLLLLLMDRPAFLLVCLTRLVHLESLVLLQDGESMQHIQIHLISISAHSNTPNQYQRSRILLKLRGMLANDMSPAQHAQCKHKTHKHHMPE